MTAIDEEEEVHDYLRGLRHRNETSNNDLAYVSMAGGLELFIDGAGFDELANINTVLFESLDEECLTLAGTPLDSKYHQRHHHACSRLPNDNIYL